MNKLMMSRQSSIVATMYSSGDTRFMIIWVSKTINPENYEKILYFSFSNRLNVLNQFLLFLTSIFLSYHLPENRSAPNTAISVSVTSPPTKICMKPPRIKIHNPAKSLMDEINKAHYLFQSLLFQVFIISKLAI